MKRIMTALVMALTALVFDATVQTSPVRAEPISNEDSFRGYFKVHIESDNSFPSVHWNLKLFANKDLGGTVSFKCNPCSDGKVIHTKRQLEREEADQIRLALRDADLYRGQYWGLDRRSLDLPIVKITFRDGSRTGTLTISGNKSFDKGSRSKLRKILGAWRKEMQKLARDDTGTKKEN